MRYGGHSLWRERFRETRALNPPSYCTKFVNNYDEYGYDIEIPGPRKTLDRIVKTPAPQGLGKRFNCYYYTIKIVHTL